MSGFSNPAKWLLDYFRGAQEDDEEQRLTAEACLHYAPVWNAVSKIAADVGQLPLVANKRIKKGGSEYARKHPAYRSMRSRPNKYQSAMVFKQTAMAQALLYGNFRAVIDRTDPKRYQLWPLNPKQAMTFLSDGEKWHVAKKDPNDAMPLDTALKVQNYDALVAWNDSDVLHILGLSLDGIEGLCLSDYASRSFGLGLAGEKSAARAAKKGFNGSLFLTAPPGQFTRQQDAEEFLKHFKEAHTGADGAGAIGLLRNGVTANAVALSGREQQALESRQFQRGDVALWFLLEQIMGESAGNSYASAVQKTISYLQNCLGKWLKTWEEECDEKLRTEKEKDEDSIFFKFNTGALLRTDMQTTATTISTLRTAMVLTTNEARELLDYNPVDGGDVIENPATTSQRQGNGTSEQTPQEPTTAQRAAIVNRIRHMIGIECKRLINATSVRNYTDWVESFYASWQDRFGDVLKELGGDPENAAEYCIKSKEEIFHLLGYAKQETLKNDIENLVANWPARAEELTEQILGVTHV